MGDKIIIRKIKFIHGKYEIWLYNETKRYQLNFLVDKEELLKMLNDAESSERKLVTEKNDEEQADCSNNQILYETSEGNYRYRGFWSGFGDQ